MAIRNKRIQQLVRTLLNENSVVHPPVPVDRIAKAHGIRIQYQPYEGDEISGLLYRDRTRTIIGVNASHHLHRQRFTIAHELGHFLLHKEHLKELHVDKAFQVKWRSDLSSQGTHPEEIEANAFAGQLLVPTDFLQKDLAKLGAIDVEDEQEIKQLAQRYQVSPQTLLIRLAHEAVSI